MKKIKQEKQVAAIKTATNNQWTNNHLKYYPDQRTPKNGPSGE